MTKPLMSTLGWIKLIGSVVAFITMAYAGITAYAFSTFATKSELGPRLDYMQESIERLEDIQMGRDPKPHRVRLDGKN